MHEPIAAGRGDFMSKVVIITGAARGIGRGIARGFAAAGATVALSGRTAESLARVVDEIHAAGGDAFAVCGDVSSASDVETLMRSVVERCGRIDVLVNNAGVFLTSPVVSMSEQDWDVTIGIDLKGVFLCCRAAAQQMIKQRSGAIVNVTSIAQVRGGTPGHAHYGAAKAGVGAFSKTLAKEVGSCGITVNCVAPGLIEDTDMGQTSKELMGASYLATIPLGRLGKVDDVVSGVLFLASDAASYITGETLNINGGSYMP